MKYKKIMLLICISICVLMAVSGAYANEVTNETISTNDADALQVNLDDVNNTNMASDSSLSNSVVYFNANATKDGDGSKSNPYKTYSSDRIGYATTAYFAEGVYDVTETSSIYSSSTYKTKFIGDGMNKTYIRSAIKNKFDFTVTENSYFVLSGMTLIDIHINNQANLIADNVYFRDSTGFNPDYPPSLSYSHISKVYDGSYGGVIICDTPQNKQTTLNLTNCYFRDNHASSGGAIATYNTIADIQNCVFYNSTASRFGGAIYSIKSTLNFKKTSFNYNYARYAGAIYSNSSQINIKDSQFAISQSERFGGAIAVFSSKLDISNTVFEDYASLNDAGGAIYAIGGSMNVAGSVFENGSANFGGAICNLKCDSTITGSDFIDNYATYYGGTIYNMYGSITLTDNDFINTRASIGGALFNRLSDSLTLTKNRFTNSAANEGNLVFLDGGKVKVVQSGNTYDTSKVFVESGSVYDVDYHKSVPVINYQVNQSDNVPSFYDARKYGYITPAKDQIQGGNCWAFAGIATLEACLSKATGIAYDFSEENVKNLMSDYSLFDLDSGVNTGGNLYMFIAYLAGWFGPTYDFNDVYDDHSSLSKIYDSIVHVHNVYILPERESFVDNNAIKKAVMAYGAVSIGIDLANNQGHAVTIVGWDDEFVSNDFLGNKAVGAWIIKNSWGTDWGFNGFGYLSYQQEISFGYTFIFDDERGYSNIYQYDFSGKNGIHSIDSNQVYLKNAFTAKKDEILSAFSTYFDEATNFTASIYLNGKLVTSQNGTGLKGYHTIPLKTEVPLTKGDKFDVEIKIFNGAPVYIPLCSVEGINKINYEKGISFYSTDGKTWIDLYGSTTPGIACIKAFTRTKTVTSISISSDSSTSTTYNNVNVGDIINIALNLPKTYTFEGASRTLDGLVTFTVNGEEYFATVENGKACLNMSFDKAGKYDVKAQFKSSRVVSNVVSFTVNVVKDSQEDVIIEANDISKYYGGSEKFVTTLTKAGKVLSGVNVKITVDGKEYTLKTDSNGQALLDLNLPVGSYDISVQYGGKKASSKFTVLSTILTEDLSQDFLSSYASASFVDTNGKALSNREISFILSYYGVESAPVGYKGTTNNYGIANAKINLYVGKYNVTVTNPVNDEKKDFILEINPIESECMISVTQPSANTVVINATLNSAQATGYVNFLVQGKVYKVTVNKVTVDRNTVAVASLRLDNMAVGSYSVSAVYSGDDDFKVSSGSRDFSVTANPYTMHSDNYWGYYGASGTRAQITDLEGNPIKGESVTAKIGGKTYTEKTDANGNATFNLDLEVGNYTVLFEYKGQSLFKHVLVYSTMNLESATAEYSNSKIGAFFNSPYDGQQPDSLDVKFIIDGKEYTAKTDSNGYASVNVDLPVGTHTITTVNLLNKEKKMSKVTVYKTTPTVSLTQSKRGEYIVFTATLSQSSAIGNVVFTMGSNKYTSPVSDGKSVLALNSLEEKTYSVYANYIGDSNFNNILSDTMQYTYRHTNFAMSADKLTKYYGGAEKFQVKLTDFGKAAAGEVITITVDGKDYDVKTDSNGIASLNINLAPKTYPVQCAIEDKIILSQIEIESTIAVKDTLGGVSQDKLSVLIMDGNGNAVKNREVTFKIGSDTYKATTDTFGIAILKPSLDKGTYTVKVTNPVTCESSDVKLEITKAAASMTLSVVKEKDLDILKAVLPKAATGEVNFVSSDGETYTAEIINGVASIECSDPGDYKVVATYDGNDVYSSVSKTIKFTVKEVTLKSVLSASKVTLTYGNGKNLVVTLKDSKGNILVGRTVIVTLNGKNYKAVIPSDGSAEIALPSNLVPKTYHATVTYKGENKISASNINVNVVVNKAAVKLTAAKKTFKVKDKTKKYVVTLKTNKNKVYKNQKITVKVNGKTYTAKTNSKGQATLKLKKLTKKGTFKATVKFAGNKYYKALSKTVKITVKK